MQYFFYQIKRLLRSPTPMFWSVGFPVILGGLFYFMFGNIADVQQFSEVPVGIIVEKQNDAFLDLMKNVEVEEDTAMFKVTEYQNTEDAEAALKKEEITGYVIVKGEDFEMVVTESSISSSLIKTFLDQYKQNFAMIAEVAVNHPQRVADVVMNLYEGSGMDIREIPLKGQDKDPYTQYFYALLAMACLIASSIGVQNGLSIQADLSSVGARRNVAPTRKMTQVLADFWATLFIYCILMTGVLAVLVFVYKRDFGTQTGLVLLATYVGSFVGLAGGTMLAVVIKGSQSAKEGLAVAFFLVSSFLGGLQWVDITYILEQNCPIINRINPATLMVNSYKSLVVFGDVSQYMVNVITLLGIGILFLGISIMKLRRTRYASL
ncbi:MAG: ABC transporter permease [Clostridium sp.]|nr:ABC transporter permease [Clostridium sp.]